MQAATCRANLGNRTRPQLPLDEPPQRPAAAPAPAARRAHPPAGINQPGTRSLLSSPGCSQRRASLDKILPFHTAIRCVGIPTKRAWKCTDCFGRVYKYKDAKFSNEEKYSSYNSLGLVPFSIYSSHRSNNFFLSVSSSTLNIGVCKSLGCGVLWLMDHCQQ